MPASSRRPPPTSREGARLLLTDARCAFLLVNEARHQAIMRTFGVSREQSNAATAVALLLLAERTRHGVEKVTHPAFTRADEVLAGASLREVVRGVAMEPGRQTPFPTTLLVFALLAAGASPTVRRSIRGATASAHRVSVGFHHRYGWIVDPGHWRRRRAQLREALSAPSPVPAESPAPAETQAPAEAHPAVA